MQSEKQELFSGGLAVFSRNQATNYSAALSARHVCIGALRSSTHQIFLAEPMSVNKNNYLDEVNILARAFPRVASLFLFPEFELTPRASSYGVREL